MQTCPFTLIRRLPHINQSFSVLCSVNSRSISRLFQDSAQLRTGRSSFSCDHKIFNCKENLGRVQYTRILSSLTMSVFSLEVIIGPAHRVIVTSASIFVGCLGFMLSVITAVIHSFFPVLFRPRVPLKSNTVSRASSRQTIRRRIEAQSSFSTTASSPSFESTDTLDSVDLKLPKASQSLSLSSSSSMEVQMRNTLPYPVHDYFPPMDPSPVSGIPHVVVTKTSLDEAPRSSHAKQRLESTGRRPALLCSATTGTDGALRGSRSMSFFKSKGHQRTPSDPPTSKTPSSPSETVVREKEKKKKIQVVRQRTQPYEAPYFVPTPVSPSSTEYLRPRLNPVRSQTMPFPQRRAT